MAFGAELLRERCTAEEQETSMERRSMWTTVDGLPTTTVSYYSIRLRSRTTPHDYGIVLLSTTPYDNGLVLLPTTTVSYCSLRQRSRTTPMARGGVSARWEYLHGRVVGDENRADEGRVEL
eukprot:4915132-Prymnesium_polylepis.1